jgi:hypothetical protein
VGGFRQISTKGTDLSCREIQEREGAVTVVSSSQSAETAVTARPRFCMASVEILRGKTLFEVRTAGVTELSLLGPSDESTADVGLMIGRAERSRHGIGSAAIGLGLVHSVRSWGVGVPVEVATSIHGSNFGVGVSLFGNLSANSFAGAALTISVGKMR